MTIPQIRDADPTTIGYETVTKWWIVPINTDNYTVTVAPNAAVAKWNAETAYLHDHGEWPRHLGPPRPARTDEIRTYAATIRKRRDDHLRNPNSITPPTDHSLALLELIESQPSGAPQRTTPTPPPQAPPPRLFDRAHLRHVFGTIAVLYSWCVVAVLPAAISTIYWFGHWVEWWTVVGWDRNLDWFTNRGVFAGYLLWGLVPVQGLWFLGWLLATGPWMERHITGAPSYSGGGLASSAHLRR